MAEPTVKPDLPPVPVATPIVSFSPAGRLVAFPIDDDPTPDEGMIIYAAHRRDRLLGTAGRWLLNDLRKRLAIT